jgi:hypothetical protein
LSIGYADGNTDLGAGATANQVLIKLTLAGDANLDGVVDMNDLMIVGQRLNTTGNDWAEGNFNYDPNGVVNFSDLLIIGQNLNQSINSAGVELGGNTVPVGEAGSITTNTTVVPEPGSVALVAAAGLLTRRRKSKNSIRPRVL